LPREALALWRGPPLDDVATEPFAALEIRRLEELRLAAVEMAIDQDIAVGRHAGVLGELETLVAQEPLRERLHALRMIALYRSGRQAAALDAYRRAREALVDEVGVEPGPELRRLHEAILRQDPALDPPAEEPAELPPSGRDDFRPGMAANIAHDARAELLERADELDGLDAALTAVTATRTGRLVFVGGEAGVGKTTLLRQFAADARPTARVLWGACDALFTPRALGPLLDVAEATAGELEDLVAGEARPMTSSGRSCASCGRAKPPSWCSRTCSGPTRRRSTSCACSRAGLTGRRRSSWRPTATTSSTSPIPCGSFSVTSRRDRRSSA
jgi:hypothetical protein